jgi:plasmid maintenance system antidote protein VapI
MNVNNRIKKIIETLENNSRVRFAAKVGISASQTSHIIRQGTKIGLRTFAHILKAYPTVSDIWLKAGEGEMLKAQASLPAEIPVEAAAPAAEQVTITETKTEEQVSEQTTSTNQVGEQQALTSQVGEQQALTSQVSEQQALTSQEILNRILEHSKQANLSQLATKINVKPQVLYNIKNGTNLGRKLARMINAKYPELSQEWLLTGLQTAKNAKTSSAKKAGAPAQAKSAKPLTVKKAGAKAVKEPVAAEIKQPASVKVAGTPEVRKKPGRKKATAVATPQPATVEAKKDLAAIAEKSVAEVKTRKKPGRKKATAGATPQPVAVEAKKDLAAIAEKNVAEVKTRKKPGRKKATVGATPQPVAAEVKKDLTLTPAVKENSNEKKTAPDRKGFSLEDIERLLSGQTALIANNTALVETNQKLMDAILGLIKPAK